MEYQRFVLSPVFMGMDTSSPELFTAKQYSPLVTNGRIDKDSFVKRPGYSLDRTLNGMVYGIILFKKVDGTRYTLYLTPTDLCSGESAGTYSYKTETYATGKATVSSPDGLTVTGSDGADFTTAAIAAGDKFILDVDHDSVNEDDATWATVSSVTNSTTIVLTAKYTGTLGAAAAGYKIRKVYSVPTNNRWAHAVADDKFCFTNTNIDVQYWSGSGYATALDSTNAKNAKYCIDYANRLLLLHCWDGSAINPFTLRWSKEGDPTDWTDDTAGQNDFIETGDYTTGLGRVGSSVIVYKRESIIIGNRTGIATSPFSFSTTRRGIGCIAPYSIVEYLGTNAWFGGDDFYYMSGDQPTSLGTPSVRHKILDTVSDSEAENITGFVNSTLSEISWIANTSSGQVVFVYNYKNKQWTTNTYPLIVSAYGIGAV